VKFIMIQAAPNLCCQRMDETLFLLHLKSYILSFSQDL